VNPEPQRAEFALRSEPTIHLTSRNFQLRFDTIRKEDRSVEAIIATDAPVMVFDYKRWAVIDEVLRMDGAILPADGQIPL
jgi:hypothetical protein